VKRREIGGVAGMDLLHLCFTSDWSSAFGGKAPAGILSPASMAERVSGTHMVVPGCMVIMPL
jgi:hypothetical protein